MNKYSAAVVAVWAVASCSGMCFAQPMGPAVSQATLCARAARARGLAGVFYTRSVATCMREHSSGSTAPAPPTVAPSSPPPPQPATAAPLTPRQKSCNDELKELGATGTAAQTFLQRCLSAH